MMFDDPIIEAKRLLPLDELMRRLGYGAYIRSSCNSPFREDKHASWGVYRDPKTGELKWKDQGTGDGNDQIDFLQFERKLSRADAIALFLDMAGVRRFEEPFQTSRPKLQAARVHSRPVPKPPDAEADFEPIPDLPPFDWEACRSALTPAKVMEIAEWRGYTPEFVEWLGRENYLGVYDGKAATPVVVDGVVVGCQYRTDDGPRYVNATSGLADKMKTPTAPLLVGRADAAEFLVMESPWDGFAILEKLNMHRLQRFDILSMVITRSASNHKRLLPVLEARAKSQSTGDIILVGQNDRPNKNGQKTGHQNLEEGVRKLCAQTGLTLKIAMPPKGVKDMNDWVRADPQADVLALMEDAKVSTKSPLTMRTVEELLAETFSDADCFWGDRVVAEGQAVTFLGPPGVGKSRLLLQFAICCVFGRLFLGMPTRAACKRWVILQTENNNRRLQADLKMIVRGLKLNAEEIKMLSDFLHIHTIETDADTFLSLDDDAQFLAIQNLITDFNPDFVMLDPLNTFSSCDLIKDADMRALCTRITAATKRGNPRRVPVVLHHSLTGKAGAQKATGWEKGSFGRGSKVLTAWTRSQVNIAPRSPDDNNRLIVACGKNNNGKHFPDIGVIFDEEVGLYVVDPTFNREEFLEEVGLQKKTKGRPKKTLNHDDVLAIMSDRKFKYYELVGLLKSEFKIGDTAAKKTIFEMRNSGLFDTETIGKSTIYFAK